MSQRARASETRLREAEESKLPELPRYPGQPERVRYDVAAGKTLQAARMVAHWLVWPGNIFGFGAPEWSRKGTIGCQAVVRTDERRNEVIAAKCTVTALPFTKRPAYIPSYSPLSGTTHLLGYREDDSRQRNCSRDHRRA